MRSARAGSNSSLGPPVRCTIVHSNPCEDPHEATILLIMHDRSSHQRSTSPLKALAHEVRTRRLELGLRQAEVADLAGCSPRFVHTVEQGKPSLRLDKLLDVLRVLGLGLMVVPGQGGIRGPLKASPDHADQT